jgi:hypothetical protein
MSYPPDPSSGWNPGGGPTTRLHRSGGATPEAYTQPLPPGAYVEYPDEDYAPKGRDYRKIFLGVLGVLLFAGSGFYAAYFFTQDAIEAPNRVRAQPTLLPTPASEAPSEAPSESPPPSPSLSPSANAEPFQDPELRDFAGRVARNDEQCRADPATNLANVTEAVTCELDGFSVRYLKFTDSSARDSYAESVRDGLDGALDVQRDSFWTDRGRQQGVFVAGSQNNDNSQYVYWNSLREDVSGEMIVQGGSRRNAERIWRQQL